MKKVEYFDQVIANCKFFPGYRITIDHCDINKTRIINFLSDNFGEGFVDEKYKPFLIKSDTWYFFIKNERYDDIIIIVKEKYQVEKIISHFNINVNIDYETLSVRNKLKNTLEKYLFELNTQKIRNQIREEVRKIIHVKPYDFDLIVDEKGIQITKNDFDFTIKGF